MSKLNLLGDLIHIQEKDLKDLDVEKLRLMLGVLRYSVRIVEREVNERVTEEEGYSSALGKSI